MRKIRCDRHKKRVQIKKKLAEYAVKCMSDFHTPVEELTDELANFIANNYRRRRK